jgi:hypothetical protein
MSIFEQATRQKLRFPSDRGPLCAEDLYDMALTSRNGFDLDSVAKAINRDLKAEDEESFVEEKANSRRAALALQLDIVKHVIATKKQENQDRLARAGRAAERARLIEILEKKQDEARLGMSEEEIRARIAELETAA